MLAYAILALSAVAVPFETRGALFAVGTSVLLLLFIGIHNASDSIAFDIFGSNRDTNR